MKELHAKVKELKKELANEKKKVQICRDAIDTMPIFFLEFIGAYDDPEIGKLFGILGTCAECDEDQLVDEGEKLTECDACGEQYCDGCLGDHYPCNDTVYDDTEDE